MNGEHTKPAPERLAQHTPGPWSVEQPLDFELSIVEANKPTYEWKFIANVPTSQEFDFPRSTAEANARLIAAAPDLLALARQYAAECATCAGSGKVEMLSATGYPAGELACEDCADIRIVIAKAEGR